MIYESGIVSATNTDLLAGGRLNAIPYNGQLTIDLLAQDNDATNNYTVTIQKPNGDVPVEAQRVPGSNPSLAGVLDDRQLLRFSFAATQGGHFTITLTETGASVVTWRAVLKP
jgi:hypothetical protein